MQNILMRLNINFQLMKQNETNFRLKHFNDRKAFIQYSNDMQDAYKNINEYNTYEKRKTLIVFDDIIADMINNKKLNSILETEK